MDNKIKNTVKFDSDLIMNKDMQFEPRMKSIYTFECFDSNNNLKWKEEINNTVVNVGLNDLLDKYFKGSTYSAAFYVGLKSNGTIASADTMASHSGWTELTNYSETSRETLTLGTVSGQSVDNSASKASFSINAGNTVGGAFVVTDNNKAGSNGVLYGAANFASPRAVADGDTLNVTVTLTAASA